MKSHKEEKNTYSKRISEKIKEYLHDYLKNIDFDMSYNNSHFVFEVKEVEVRSDILKKFGIPLELIKGKVQEIKVTIQSLTFNKPILIEVSGINVEMRTIYLSRDYKKDYKNFRQKILDEWEKNHREFLQNLMKKESFVERLMINQMIPMKIEVKNIKIVITDTVTSQVPRKIALVIGNVTSYGCDQLWEPIHQQKEDMEEVRRIFNISKGFVNIYQEKYVREEEAEIISTDNSFIQPLDIQIKVLFPVKKNPNLRRIPKLHLEVSVESPILLDISISKLKFLNNFLNYLLKIKEVEKYWIHRPELKDDKVNATMAKEWFKYAFRVVREEVRNRKRQNNDFSTLIEKIINMERYTQFYKTSHKLIIAPWIIYNDRNEDLQALENKMTLEDVIYCRELAFTELITEGKAFCATGEIGEGYKPLVHLWEFYVNDLRSKWMNKSDQNSQIELTPEERRDLMMIANLDRDKVIMSYLKGEPNHPEDIISSIKINLDVLIINISRKVKFNYKSDKLMQNKESEISEQMKFYQSIYIGILEKNLQKSKFFEYLNDLSEDEIRSIILEEGKVDLNLNESHSDEEKSNNNLFIGGINKNVELNYLNNNKENIKKSMEIKNTEMSNQNDTDFIPNREKERDSYNIKSIRRNNMINLRFSNTNQNLNDSNSVDYLDDDNEPTENLDDRESYPQMVINQLKPINTNPIFIRDSMGQKKLISNSNINTFAKFSTEMPYQSMSNLLNKNPDYDKNTINELLKKPNQFNLRKTLFSIVLGQINVNQTILRNDAENSNVKIFYFNVIDHNLTYALVNKHNEVNEDNQFSGNLDSILDKDYIRLLFQQMFSENDYHSFNYLEDKRLDPAEMTNPYFELTYAKFLSDILIMQKNRDTIFMKDFLHERTFINDFIYKFGFREIDINSELTQIEEYYQKLVIFFLLEKNILKDKLSVIEKTIKETKMNYLLHEKYNIFNKKFIQKVFEKGVTKNLFKNKSQSNVTNINLMNKTESKMFKRETFNIADEEFQKDEKIRKEMIGDLNFVMQEICVNLIKYIFSSLYPYFMNEKGIQLVFKKNIKLFCDKISEKLREDNKKSTSLNMGVGVPDNEFFLSLKMTKQGREYPNYIYKEMDSVDMDRKLSENKRKTSVTEKSSPDKNRNFIYKEDNDKKLNYIQTTNSHQENKNSLSIKLNKDINFIFSNETIAELILIMPLLTIDDSEKISFAGNILNDLKKSYLEIYENLRQFKAKWKVMEYLKNMKEKKNQRSQNNLEMNYLLSKLKHLEEISKSLISINLHIYSINFEVIDKLYFVTYEKNSSVTLRLSDIYITNNKMDKLPILLIENIDSNDQFKNINTQNKIKNSKNFDFDLILKMFSETKIDVEKILILIDNQYPILESNLKIKVISSMLQNVPFLPNSIIDLNSEYIKINVTPNFMKISSILSNLSYYQDLYRKKFEITKTLQEILKKANRNKEKIEKDNTSTIIAHFHKKLQKNLIKLLSDKERYKGLVSYIKNRTNLILFYSIGKYNPRVLEMNNKVDYKNGIFIEFKEYDTPIREIFNFQSNKFTHSSIRNGLYNLDENKLNESKNSTSIEDNNIFTLHIPILVYNFRETLFYEQKQLWLSDVFTFKLNSDPNLNFEKLKIKFDSDEQFNFTSFEFLFCKLFLNTTDYLLYNNDDIHNLDDANFTSQDFPFDFKFTVPLKLKLNNLYSQKSFYYEQEEILRNKIYSNLFHKKNNQKLGEILSYFKISIEKISFQIFAKNNSQILKFYENIKNFSSIENDLKMNRQIIDKEEINDKRNINLASDINSRREEKKSTKKLSMHRISIMIKDIKLKAFYDIVNSHDNPMVFFVVNNICYQENMNILMHNLYDNSGKKDIPIKDKFNKNSPIILSNLFISSIKLVISLPSYFRSEDNPEERIKILDELKMKEIFEAMKKEKNKLIVMGIGNISAKLILKEGPEIEFEIGDCIKFGFVDREGEKVDPNEIELNKIEPIIWISATKTIRKKNTENILDFISEDSNEGGMLDLSNDDSISNEIFKENQNENFNQKMNNNNINYSIKLLIVPIKSGLNCKSLTEDESNLFYNILKSLTIVHSLTTLQNEYKMNININLVNVEIPWYMFHYIYYLRNHLLEIKSKVQSIQKIEINPTIEIYDETLSNKFNLDTNNDNRLTTEKNEERNPTISIVKDTMPIIKRNYSPKNNQIKRISVMGQLHFANRKVNEQSSNKKDLKDKIYNMVNINIPNLSICLRQKDLNNEDVIFFDLNLFDVTADVLINFADRGKDVISLKVKDAKLKPYESRYHNLIVKHESNKSDLIEIEIKLNMQLNEIKNKFLRPKEISEDQIKIIINLRQATFVMINKTIKDLILFIEYNTECLKENPLKEHLKLLDQIQEDENILFKMNIHDGAAVLPESSQSANLIVLNFRQASILFKESNEVPKICFDTNKQVFIIDKKTTFNIKPMMADVRDLIPHTRIEVMVQDFISYFYINNEFEQFLTAEALNVTLKSPSSDSIVFGLRREMWKEKFNCNVVSYKPSIIFDIAKAEINSTMVRIII